MPADVSTSCFRGDVLYLQGTHYNFCYVTASVLSFLNRPSVFLYLFIHVMFATFCVYLVYDFYRAACNADAGLAMRILSVCHTRVLWQNGRKICPDFYTIRKNI